MKGTKMEDKIEVGEYVRTKDGYIGKLVEYIPNALNYLKIDIGRETIHSDNLRDNFIYTRYGFKLKHSKQLIDLIEVGDIVGDKYNKYEVAFIAENKIYCNDYNYDDSLVELEEKDIKTILTKESYMANCYKVGGE